jgi:hypothetical protein
MNSQIVTQFQDCAVDSKGKGVYSRVTIPKWRNGLKCPEYARNCEKKGTLRNVVTILELEIASNQAFLPQVHEKQNRLQVAIQKIRNLLKTPEEKNLVCFAHKSLPHGTTWSLLNQTRVRQGYDSLRRQGGNPCD